MEFVLQAGAISFFQLCTLAAGQCACIEVCHSGNNGVEAVQIAPHFRQFSVETAYDT